MPSSNATRSVIAAAILVMFLSGAAVSFATVVLKYYAVVEFRLRTAVLFESLSVLVRIIILPILVGAIVRHLDVPRITYGFLGVVFLGSLLSYLGGFWLLAVLVESPDIPIPGRYILPVLYRPGPFMVKAWILLIEPGVIAMLAVLGGIQIGDDLWSR